MAPTDRAYFEGVTWCGPLLCDTNWSDVPTRSRTQKPTKEDEFFAKTLHTDDTISACLTQIRFSSQQGSSPQAVDEDNIGSLGWRPPISDARTLFALSSGVNGYTNIAHGGVVASLLDEVMGFLITTNTDHDVQRLSRLGSPVDQTPLWARTVTAELNVKYRRPVPTGDIVLVRAWFEDIRGNKIAIRATIEDSRGQCLSEGTGRFVSLAAGAGRAFQNGARDTPKI
jgi:acyl-coenzyme A thioesterase THEM4